MEQIHDRVAGLDVHRDQVTACVRIPGPRGGARTEKGRFGTTTGGLAALAEWLSGHAITLAAMEATGVYWKPVCYALEDRFLVWLCNAHHVRNVPGRKTDMSDAEWLADVAAHGMVRPSFVPPPPIRELRGADTLPQDAGRRAGSGDRPGGEGTPGRPGSSSPPSPPRC